VEADVPFLRSQVSHFFEDRVLGFRIEQIGTTGSHFHDRRPGVVRPMLPWDVECLDRAGAGGARATRVGSGAPHADG
jgi:hypothetical protein